MTVTTSSVSYCTPAEFLTYYDQRSVGRLVVDTDPATPITGNALLTNPVLVNALLTASGRLEAKALKGKRYAVLDLQTLAGLIVGTTAGASGAYLKEMVATIAMVRLIQFRPSTKIPMPEIAKEVFADLERLGNGEEIFAFAEVADAGVMEFAKISNTDVMIRNDVVSQAKAYFGDRSVDVSPWGVNTPENVP